MHTHTLRQYYGNCRYACVCVCARVCVCVCVLTHARALCAIEWVPRASRIASQDRHKYAGRTSAEVREHVRMHAGDRARMGITIILIAVGGGRSSPLSSSTPGFPFYDS